MCRKWIGLAVVILAVGMVTSLAQGQTVKVNFQQPASETPDGYLGDGGEVFGDRGNGYSYGWDRNISADARDRNSGNSLDQRYDTLIHFSKGADAVWEIVLPNGQYSVFMVCGDPDNTDQVNNLDVEGVIVEDPDGEDNYDEYEVTVTVADGRLTVTVAEGSDNAKICFIDITLDRSPGQAAVPSPDDGATDVPRDVVLAWQAGVYVVKHDVYLGTSFDDVNAADSANPLGVLASAGQSAASYDPDGLLDFGQTYYWRVDEVNGAPDFTVFSGDVWSFTTEPFSYPVENVVATASSAHSTDMAAGKTVDGSGLDSNDGHSTTGTDMWLSGGGDPGPVWIQYEFDRAYRLQEMLVWNSNQQIESFVGMGVKDVTVEYSTDGVTWIVLADVPEIAQGSGVAGDGPGTTVDFGGAMAKYVKLTINDNWGMLSQYGLSEVRFMSVPVQAREPQPADGARGVALDVVLNWRVGRGAAVHEVYFSDVEQDVVDGTALVDTISEHSYQPSGLEYGKTYYWKINEVNEAADVTSVEGDVWSFSTTEYFAVDDMESYTDDEFNRIYETWVDGWTNGTGSVVGYLTEPFAEQTIVNSGSQSMPLDYNNVNSPWYSEAERTWDSPQNWTAYGADTLTLHFRGNAVGFVETGPGTFTMGGAGADIWNTADEFRYAFKRLNGNGSIVARVDSLVDTNGWAKVGVMIRETLDAGSTFAAVYISPANGCRFQARASSNSAAISDSGVATPEQIAIVAPYWVKIERTGNDFSGYYSADGVTWTAMAWNPQAIAMINSTYIGLAVTSHSSGVSTTAEFSGVSTTGNVSGAWEALAIGVEQPANDPAPLYVAVEDSAGKVKAVTHPDENATLASSWQAWEIPLSEFSDAGVNLTKVEKIYVGVGDRDNPTPDGAGLLYIDDIRVGRPAPEVVPSGDWLYTFDGDAAVMGPDNSFDSLDGTWDHDNGSDAWDGTGPGEGMPGGAAALLEDGVTFLRIQDTGDPRDYGNSDPTNRKVYLTRPVDVSLDGVSLDVRIRVATSAPLDDLHPDGGAGIEPWPAGGIGYEIRDNGTGMFGVAEGGLGIISFSLVKDGDPGTEGLGSDGLIMNSLVGTEPSGDVDTGDSTAFNVIAIDDATQWHTFAIDIVAGGAGTHVVTVSVDGGEAQSFDVTAGTKLENDASFIALGSSGTGAITAFDVDYISVK